MGQKFLRRMLCACMLAGLLFFFVLRGWKFRRSGCRGEYFSSGECAAVPYAGGFWYGCVRGRAVVTGRIAYGGRLCDGKL